MENTAKSGNQLTNTFEYDYENRLLEHNIASVGVTVEHAYDGLDRRPAASAGYCGRGARPPFKTTRAVSGGATTDYEHVRNGLLGSRGFQPRISQAESLRYLTGNIDATNSNTAPTWTNHPHASRPVESQQLQTNSATQFINVSDEISPSRRTYNPGTSAAGDTEAIAAKGRLVLVNGAVPTVMAQTTLYPSELFSHRNPTYSENTIALPSDRGALEISGTNLMYEGTRVKTWIIGRDVNPGGRGFGTYYAHGMFNVGLLRPIASDSPILGIGNSVNNGNGDHPPFKEWTGNDCDYDVGDCVHVGPAELNAYSCKMFACRQKLDDTTYPCAAKENAFCDKVFKSDPVRPLHTIAWCFNCIGSRCYISGSDYETITAWVVFNGDEPRCAGYGMGWLMNEMADGGCPGCGAGTGGCAPGVGGGMPGGMTIPGPLPGEIGPMGTFYFGSIAPRMALMAFGPWDSYEMMFWAENAWAEWYKGFHLIGCRNTNKIKNMIDSACSMLNDASCMKNAPKTKKCMNALCSGSKNTTIICGPSMGQGATYPGGDRAIVIRGDATELELFHEMYHRCDPSTILPWYKKSEEKRAHACMWECGQVNPQLQDLELFEKVFGKNFKGNWSDYCCDSPAFDPNYPPDPMEGWPWPEGLT